MLVFLVTVIYAIVNSCSQKLRKPCICTFGDFVSLKTALFPNITAMMVTLFKFWVTIWKYVKRLLYVFLTCCF